MANKITVGIRNLFRNWMRDMGYYAIDELQVGGHCGLCGKWIPDKIFPKYWAWGMCKEHLTESE